MIYFVSKGKPATVVVIEFLKWILTDGQKFVEEAGYVNLSEEKITITWKDGLPNDELEEAEIIEKTIDISFLITFDYKNMNKVMRVIKEKKLDIITQTMELDENSGIAMGKIEIKTRKKNAELIFDIFDNLFEIEIKRL